MSHCRYARNRATLQVPLQVCYITLQVCPVTLGMLCHTTGMSYDATGASCGPLVCPVTLRACYIKLQICPMTLWVRPVAPLVCSVTLRACHVTLQVCPVTVLRAEQTQMRSSAATVYIGRQYKRTPVDVRTQSGLGDFCWRARC